MKVLLPTSIAASIDIALLASATKLVFQVGAPMKAGVREGWIQEPILHSLVLQRSDLNELARRFGWKKGRDSVTIAGSPHRAVFSDSELTEASNITVHIGRFVPGCAKGLFQDDAIVLEPSASGKTTWLRLRSAAVEMGQHGHVLVLDTAGHLADLGPHEGMTYSGGANIEVVQRAIEHAPRMIVADFQDAYTALKAARLCKEACVQLAGSLRSNLGFLVEVFVMLPVVDQKHGERHAAAFPSLLQCPFPRASRNLSVTCRPWCAAWELGAFQPVCTRTPRKIFEPMYAN
eukprot:Skav218506  [mRNA]  locus=scaffold1564:81398:82267:+ [translate_table: standard]